MAKKNKSPSEIKFLNGKDSKEEVYVEWYLQELKDAGIIIDFWYHPEVYTLSNPAIESYTVRKQLKRSVKTISKTRAFHRGHTYRPDFRIRWNFKTTILESICKRYVVTTDLSVFVNGSGYFFSNDFMSDIDVKPAFNKRTADKTTFSINQSLVLNKYRIYVQKITEEELFEKTFTPKRFLMTDSGKQMRKINFNVRTLEEFLTFDKF